MEHNTEKIESLIQNVSKLPLKDREKLLTFLKQSIHTTETKLDVNESERQSTFNSTVGSNICNPNNILSNTPNLQAINEESLKKRLVFKPKSKPNYRQTYHGKLSLACPVCQVKATTWDKFSHHLYMGHGSSSSRKNHKKSSVCRRCHGIFYNRALLLAHECFHWGQMNLPCSAIYSSINSTSLIRNFGFPPEGVYLERHCGLCVTSDVVYSNFEVYERHKYEEHAESASKSCSFGIQRPKDICFQGPALTSLFEPGVGSIVKRGRPVPLGQPRVGRPKKKTESPKPSQTHVPNKMVAIDQGSTLNDPSKQVVCLICKLHFRSASLLEYHKVNSAMHRRKALRSKRKAQQNSVVVNCFLCFNCGLVYARKASLERHIAFKHRGETKAFVCEYCQFRAADRAQFTQHMARHFHLKNIACEQCDFRCVNKHELEDHVKFKHQDERSFHCPVCQETFKTSGTLWRHKKTHSGVTHGCDQCSASFNRVNNLHRHVATVHAPGKQRSSQRHRRNVGKTPILRGEPQTRRILPRKPRLAEPDVYGIPQSITTAPSSPSQENGQPMNNSLLSISCEPAKVASEGIISTAAEESTYDPSSSNCSPQFHSVVSDSEPINSHLSVLPSVSDLFFPQPITFEEGEHHQEQIIISTSIWRPMDDLRVANNVPDEDLSLICDTRFDDRHCPHSPVFENFLSNALPTGTTTWVPHSGPKFSDMLPVLNSSQSQHSYVDQLRSSNSNFSVGYLIGGGDRGLIRGSAGDCGSPTMEPHFPSPLLSSSLPISDCLSLVPISNNLFDDARPTIHSSWANIYQNDTFHETPETE